MEKADLSNFPQEGEQYIFSDEIKDDLKVSNVKLSKCRFLRIGANKASFNKTDLAQCLFEDSYFRNASFQDVDFTGSTFKNCNLEKANFQGCKLRYCTFQNTKINRDEIISCLPVEPNIRLDVARNLRKNFEALGDKVSVDAFMDIEIKAYEEDLVGVFRRKTKYYREHYTNIEQVCAFFKLLGSRLSGLVWGYGHRVRRLFGSYIILSIIFAIIVHGFKLSFYIDNQASTRTLDFFESLYYIFSETLGVGAGSLVPVSAVGKVFQLGVGFFGILFLALLAASVYRRIAR